MRTKISAVIIDKDYIYHDYFSINTIDDDEESMREKYFDIKVFPDDSNILSKLNEHRGYDVIITIGNEEDFKELYKSPSVIREKWINLPEFDSNGIINAILGSFEYNIERKDKQKLFSIFTCAFNTGKMKLDRLYNSLLNQEYSNWDLYILDDSTNDEVQEIVKGYNDPRITVFKNCSVHGNIGFNKHTIAMACDGDYLVEMDHDDELTPNCLKELYMAFEKYPDSDFVYSNALELAGNEPISYGKEWGFYEGTEEYEMLNGRLVRYAASPDINPYTIRTIYAQPNHVRCWKKDFYHKIGGHDVNLSVLDDMEILIRTFLYGKMTHIAKILYIQYEGTGERGKDSSNTQSTRFNEIQRDVFLIKQRYDRAVHNRILELGFDDEPWNEEYGCSTLLIEHKPHRNIMSNRIY